MSEVADVLRLTDGRLLFRSPRTDPRWTPQSAGPDLEGVVMTVPDAAVNDVIHEAEPLTVDDAYARSHRAALTRR